MNNLVLFLLILPFLSSTKSFAQDIITMMDGQKVEVKILKIDLEKIEYKKMSYLDGPVYSYPISQISSISYPNGETEYYNIGNDYDRDLPQVDIENYKGFLLAKGNAVYVTSGPADYERAAAETLRKLIKKDGFWKVAPSQEQAHFIITYNVNLKGQDTVDPWFIQRRDPFTQKERKKTDLTSFFNPLRPFYTNESISKNIEVAEKLYKRIQGIQKESESSKVKNWQKFFTL